MMDTGNVIGQFKGKGYVVLRNHFDVEKILKLRQVCDLVHSQWLAQNLSKRINKKTLACLTDPFYHSEHLIHQTTLLETIADERILLMVEGISNHRLIVNDAQYSFDPVNKSRQG